MLSDKTERLADNRGSPGAESLNQASKIASQQYGYLGII